MKIGVIVDNEFNSDTRVTNETDLFEYYGLAHAILCFNFRTIPRHPNEKNISRLSLPRKLKDVLYATDNTFRLYSWYWMQAIKRFIKQKNITHLHVHDLYMALWARRKSSIKAILDMHENYPYAVEGYNWTKQFPHKLFAHPRKWKKVERSRLSKVITLLC